MFPICDLLDAAKAFEEKFQECGTGQTMLSFIEDGVWMVSMWSGVVSRWSHSG